MACKVLYIEDDPYTLRLMRKMLIDGGFEFIEAINGRDGYDAVIKERPDIILMDISLPDMDGLAIAARLKRLPDYARTPIIAVSGNMMHGDRERFANAGCDGYLAKPVMRNELINTINRFAAQAASGS